MHKARKIFGIMMVLMMVLTIGGTALKYPGSISYAVGDNTAQGSDTDNDTASGSGSDQNGNGADPDNGDDDSDQAGSTDRNLTTLGDDSHGTWPKDDSTDIQTNTWSIDDNGVMTVSGSGAMTDYNAANGFPNGVKDTPWQRYRKESEPYIKKLVVGTGITHLPSNMLTRPAYLEEIDASGCHTLEGEQGTDMFKATAQPSGEQAVKSMLKRVDFSGNTELTGFGPNPSQAFRDCKYIEYIDFSDTKIRSSVFSDNTYFINCCDALKTLKLQNCKGGINSDFKTLDLSSYSVLEELDLRGCSNLNSLKLHKTSTSLKILRVSNTFKKEHLKQYVDSSNLTIYFDGTYAEWKANGFDYDNGKWGNVNVVFTSKVQITDGSNIVYYDSGETTNRYRLAQFETLKDAYDKLNVLYTDDEGTTEVTGPVTIEVREEEYELQSVDYIEWNNTRSVTISKASSIESCVIKPNDDATHDYMFSIGSGDITFSDITIDGDSKKGIATLTDGGGKLALGGSAELINGKAENGGAVKVTAGTLTMKEGSEIKDCSATGNGSAIYLGAGTFKVEGGSISGCAPKSADDGAVYVASPNARLEFKGSPVITGNMYGTGASAVERNIYLGAYYADMITATGTLPNATIGLYINVDGHYGTNDVFGKYLQGVTDNDLTSFRNDRTKVGGVSLIGWHKDSTQIYWASPVKLKYVEKKSDGTYSPMPSLNDTSFILGSDRFYSNEDIMEEVRGEGQKTPPVISDDCFFHFFGLGADTPSADYDSLDTFYLKQGEDGVYYSADGQGTGTLLNGVNTVYVIYSKDTPAGSANLTLRNQTSYELTINKVLIGNDIEHISTEATAVVRDESGHLSLLDENTGKFTNSSLDLVVLKGAEKYFGLEGGYNIQAPDVLAIKINITGTDEIYLEGEKISEFGPADVKAKLREYGEYTVGVFTAETSEEMHIYKIWIDDSDSATHDKSNYNETVTLQFLDSNGDPVRVRESANRDNPNFVSADERQCTVTLTHNQGEEWDPTKPLKVVVPDTAVDVTELAVPGYINTNNPEIRDKQATVENTRAVCKITYTEGGKTIEQPFATMKDAMAFAVARSMTEPVIEMLLDYSMPSTDALDIPSGYTVTITTASKDESVIHKYSGPGTTATIRRKSDFTSGSMFVNYYETSTLVLKNVLLDGRAYGDVQVSADSAMITNGGDLEIREDTTLQNAVSTGNGGAVYSTGGSIIIEKTEGSEGADPVINNNTAANGGAIYIKEGSIDIIGGVSVTGNTSSATDSAENGNGGAFYLENGELNITGDVELTGNTAGGYNYDGTTPGGNGGAVYAEKGSISFAASDGTSPKSPKVEENKAGNGGAVYLNEASVDIGEKVTIGGTSGKENTAEQSGGAVYAVKGMVSLSGTISNNIAKGADGGAIYSESGPVDLMDGMTIKNNSANAASGKGGAVYAGSGKITMYGGTIGGNGSGNSASNGSAIYVYSGTAELSGGKITGNTSTAGGAVSTGAMETMLVFGGKIEVKGNKKNGEECNVFLDKDSDTIITSDVLIKNAYIGVYVDGPLEGDLFKKRGQAGCRFATFIDTAAKNLDSFHNDRQPALKAMREADVKKVIWSSAIKVNVRYLANYDGSVADMGGFPPKALGTQKYPATGDSKEYYPSASDLAASQVADDLYEVSGIQAPATFGGAYIKGETAYSEYIKKLYWSSTQNSWMYETRTGSHKVNNTDIIYIYFSDPAYISIENNWKDHNLDISNITINGMTAVDNESTAGYGYVVAKNGMTKETLEPIHKNSTDRDKDDLYLKPGESVKLMFPGACGKTFSIAGGFENLSAGTVTKLIYTGPSGDVEESFTANDNFPVEKTTLSEKGGTFEVIFERRKYVCKVKAFDGEHPFTSIQKALTYIKDGGYTPPTGSDNKTAAIEMLVDYLIPSTDEVKIPEGYNITLKTAAREGGGEVCEYYYEGASTEDPPRATISRDTKNTATLITNSYSSGNYPSLTIEGIIFDGRNMAGASNGGAISTKDCRVTVKDSKFSNFIAEQGAALFVDYTISGATYAADAYSILTVSHTDFENCQSKTDEQKKGGGAIWTTAKKLSIGVGDSDENRSRFYKCSASDQAGAIFHNIKAAYANGTETIIQHCNFEACEAKAAGAVETDAADVHLEYCHVKNCKATERNGGAFNIYSRDNANTTGESYATVKHCIFEDCHADNEAKDNFGGGLRIAAYTKITVDDCTFDYCTSKQGGAFAISNTNALEAEITNCTFTNCRSSDNGGGIFSRAKVISMDTVNISNCTSTKANGGGIWLERNLSGSSADLNKVKVENCSSKGTTGGGGIFINMHSATVRNSQMLNNSSAAAGGGVCDIGDDKVLVFENCTISGNTASTRGGGVYTKANMTIRKDTMITGNTLTTDNKNDAAGVFMEDGRTLTVGTENATVKDSSSIMENTTSSGTGSNLRLWSYSNGNNSTSSVKVLCDLGAKEEAGQLKGGKIYVVNAASKGTQFGISLKEGAADPEGFTDLDHVFEADDGSLYGIVHRADSDVDTTTLPKPYKKRLVWSALPVCKITDINGDSSRLLYIDDKGKRPAVFDLLDDRSADGKRTSAFNLLRNSELQLYYADGTPYDGSEYAVRMLVEEYQENNYMVASLPGSGTKITFTTESRTTKTDEDPYPYRGKPGSTSTIKRGTSSNNAMLEAKVSMDLTNIVLDGNRDNITSNADTRVIMMKTNGVEVLLGNKATLKNAKVNNSGGAVALNYGKLIINGGTISNCQATSHGGGVYVANNASLEFISGKITGCKADANGGGVYHNSSTAFEMKDGSSINGCEALSGGGLHLCGSRTINMSGGEITGNKATEKGGGIAVNAKSKINLSGKVIIYGNKVGGYNNNIHLDQDSNAIINATGITDSSSVIGVYTPEGPIRQAHGIAGAPFGSYTNTDIKLLRCFVNDADPSCIGGVGDKTGIIYWVHDFSLKVSKMVNSDKDSDQRELFRFTINLLGTAEDGTTGGSINGTYGDITFNGGTAKIAIRSGESRTAASLPVGIDYVVSEDRTSLYQGYYTTTPDTDISGRIGDHLYDVTVQDRYQSLAHFINSHTSAMRRVILRKVDSSYNPQANYNFYVFKNNNKDYAVDGHGDTLNPKRNGEYLPLTSMSPSGVIWAGDLPYGDYFIREGDNYWFYMIVDGKGQTKLNTRYNSYDNARHAYETEKQQRGGD